MTAPSIIGPDIENALQRNDALRVLALALASQGYPQVDERSLLRDIEEGGYTLRLTTAAERKYRNDRGQSSWSDASVVFIEARSLTMARPGRCIYHLSRRWTYGSVTRCGRVIWRPSSDPGMVTLVPMRRDNASRIGRPCRVCGADDD